MTQDKPIECKCLCHKSLRYMDLCQGLCERCAMKMRHQPTQPVEEWEDKFDNLFTHTLDEDDEKLFNWNADVAKVKSFIRSLLSAKEAEVRRKTIEEVELMIGEAFSEWDTKYTNSEDYRADLREKLEKKKVELAFDQEMDKVRVQFKKDIIEELKHVKGGE